MRAFVYQSALYCEPCGDKMREDIPRPAHADVENESTWDSGEWPTGPYESGGGEADAPQHCDACGTFLRNPLTDDGREYVRERIAACHTLQRSGGKLHVAWTHPAVQEWSRFYGIAPGEAVESDRD